MTEHEDKTEDDFERITPATIRPGQPTPSERRRADKTSVPAAPVAALGVVLLAAGIGAVVWISDVSAPPATTTATPATHVRAGAQSNTAEQEPSPPDADQVLAARQHAQTLRKQLGGKRKTLQEHSVKRWAAKPYQAVEQGAKQGAKLFGERQYAAAADAFGQAITQADDLMGRVDKVLADALARGDQALADGDRRAAARAFDLALAIAPGNAKASKGAARAASLDRVLALMRAGRDREQAGKLVAARSAYRKARRLDGAYAPAKTALARVTSALAKRRFDHYIGAGRAALAHADYTAARTAFRAAGKIRPHADTAARGLARAQAGLRDRAVAAHRGKAQQAVADAQWHRAVAQYDKILALDATLAFAQQGRQRAKTRADLDDKLSYHLEHPQRLDDAAVRADVGDVLDRARAVDDPGPHLRAQIARLSARLAAASQPVAVRLRSDGHTRVAVYHVGRLGTFESKALRLTPGTYTAIGHRDGYRDVRQQFTVTAGAPAGPVTIVCREKL